MEPDLWRRAEEVFHAALERAPGERRVFLDDACGGDGELRRQVEILLSKDAQAGSFLESGTGSLAGRELGPYHVVAPLGAGGMGEVYRAHDGKLGRDVAIKTLPAEFARNADRLARFRREARTLASLNHPNIAAIYGLEESGDVDCLVLELVEGETLHGPMPIGPALECARQVAEGLEAAHARGVIHRDLKPANVKITPEGRVKILDFGLAKAVWGREQNPDLLRTATMEGGETMVGHIIGTPGYMSPEQASGGQMDARTDVWAFGCVLYELLAGKRAFAGETAMETIAAVLEREPDWTALPAKTPAGIRELLRQCLQKDATRRLPNIGAARQAIEREQRGKNWWRPAAIAAVVLAVAAVGAALWLRGSARPADRSQWVQLTNFPDSVGQPAFSNDGRMLTFLHSDSNFVGPGQVYVKMLPDGEPVQLTHDDRAKMSPAFSPDGSRIAYTVVNPIDFTWDTWSVPTLGGEAQLWLKNASGLAWTGVNQLMFSELKMGIHMGVVTSQENRMGARDVYLPQAEPNMAHRSYLSPDRKWVLLVEMDEDHMWEQCRVVPADGSSQGRKVGPAGGGCTSGAWTPDSQWIYLTSNAVAANHLWRQKMPDGKPEQVTSGPTEEEGVAMSPDGRSVVTAVALQKASLWVHDAKGERSISIDGNSADPMFTRDGRRLFYRKVTTPWSEWNAYRDPGEIHVADLESGRSEVQVPGLKALNYDLSPDGREIVMEVADEAGKPRMWIAQVDRSGPPLQIPNLEGSAPKFGPDGDIVYRHVEGYRDGHTSGFIYRVHRDGTGIKKVSDRPVLIFASISPDRRWIQVWAPLGGDGLPTGQGFPLDGGAPLVVGATMNWNWSPGGSAVALMSQFGLPIAEGRCYIVPLARGELLPKVPAGGYHTESEISSLPGARRVDTDIVFPGPSANVYAYYRAAALRNLYRIPLQ